MLCMCHLDLARNCRQGQRQRSHKPTQHAARSLLTSKRLIEVDLRLDLKVGRKGKGENGLILLLVVKPHLCMSCISQRSAHHRQRRHASTNPHTHNQTMSKEQQQQQQQQGEELDAGLAYVRDLVAPHPNFPIEGVLFHDSEFEVFESPIRGGTLFVCCLFVVCLFVCWGLHLSLPLCLPFLPPSHTQTHTLTNTHSQTRCLLILVGHFLPLCCDVMVQFSLHCGIPLPLRLF